MQLNNNIQTSPNFQARLIVVEPKVQKYINSSFLTNRKETSEILGKFNSEHTDSVVLMNLRNIKNRPYLIAKNGKNGITDKKLLYKDDVRNRTSFIDFIQKLLKNNEFWK